MWIDACGSNMRSFIWMRNESKIFESLELNSNSDYNLNLTRSSNSNCYCNLNMTEQILIVISV